jgi:hypothetical protein
LAGFSSGTAERCALSLADPLHKANDGLKAEFDYIVRVTAPAKRIAAIKAARLKNEE